MSRKISYPTDDESNDIVKRYEQFLNGTATGYFDVEELETIVEYYLRRGRTKDGSKALEFGLKLHPNSNALKTKRAKVYLAVGDVLKAFRILDSLTETSDYEVILLKIEALLRLNRIKDAKLLCDRLLSEENDDLDNICLDLAFIYISQLEIETALELLKRGDDFNDQNQDLLFELAFCYEQTAENDNAIDTYNRIIDIDPYMAEAWFNLGQIYFTSLDYVSALKAYDFALIINENDSLTCLQKAHSQFQLNLFSEAIDTYLEYEKMVTDTWQTNLFIGECYEKMEHFNEAILYYKKSLEEHPDNYEALTGISICLLEQEFYAESMTFTRQALELQEDAPDAWVYLAEGLIGVDDTQNALLAYLKSITLEPNQPDTLMAIANICMDNGEFELALQYYLTAIDLDEALELINLFIAVAYYKTGKLTESGVYLQKALNESAEALNMFTELCPEAPGFIQQFKS